MLAAFALLVPLLAPPADPALRVDYPAKGGVVTTFAGESTLTWLVPQKLPPDVKTVFDTEFLSLGYFGAWASAPGNGYGFVSGAGSLTAAREIAMAQCQSQNSDCVLAAELVPSDYVEPASNAITLSEAMTREYFTPDRGAYKAFAVSEDGAYGLVWGYGSQADANADALSQCTGSMMQVDLGLRPMPCILVPVP